MDDFRRGRDQLRGDLIALPIHSSERGTQAANRSSETTGGDLLSESSGCALFECCDRPVAVGLSPRKEEDKELVESPPERTPTSRPLAEPQREGPECEEEQPGQRGGLQGEQGYGCLGHVSSHGRRVLEDQGAGWSRLRSASIRRRGPAGAGNRPAFPFSSTTKNRSAALTTVPSFVSARVRIAPRCAGTTMKRSAVPRYDSATAGKVLRQLGRAHSQRRRSTTLLPSRLPARRTSRTPAVQSGSDTPSTAGRFKRRSRSGNAGAAVTVTPLWPKLVADRAESGSARTCSNPHGLWEDNSPGLELAAQQALRSTDDYGTDNSRL